MVSTKKLASGFVWVAVIAYSNRILGFAATLILANLLSPAEFGVVAVASMTMEVLRVVKDMGLSEALIYQKRDDPAALETANTLLVGFNVILFLGAAAISPLVARFYDRPILMPVIIVISSNLIWDSARAVPRTLMRKNIDFHKLVVPEIVPVVVSSVISIWMAIVGFGVWSLVAKTVVHSVLGMILLRANLTHRLRFRFDRQAARELFRYGKFIMGTTTLLVVLYNIDRFFVSRVVGIAALGFYELAMRLAELPVKEFAFIVGSVMFPVFTSLNGPDGSLGRALLKTVKYATFVSAPIAMGIAVYGPTVIAQVYGERWAGVVVPLQVLSFYAMCRAMSSIIHDGFKAMGRPDLMQRVVLFRLVVIGSLGIPALKMYGLPGICWVILATYIAALAIEVWTLTAGLGLGVLETLESIVKPVTLATIVPLSYFVVRAAWGAPSRVGLGAIAVVSALLYLAAIYCFERQAIRDIRTVLASRRSPGPLVEAGGVL